MQSFIILSLSLIICFNAKSESVLDSIDQYKEDKLGYLMDQQSIIKKLEWTLNRNLFSAAAVFYRSNRFKENINVLKSNGLLSDDDFRIIINEKLSINKNTKTIINKKSIHHFEKFLLNIEKKIRKLNLNNFDLSLSFLEKANHLKNGIIFRKDELSGGGFPSINTKVKYYQKLLQCNDRPYAKLSLDGQFPKTYNQGNNGNCWSYSGTSLVQSALKRNTNITYEMDPGFNSLVTASDYIFKGTRFNQMIKALQKNSSKEYDDIIDGGMELFSINSLLKYQTSISDRDYGKKLLDRFVMDQYHWAKLFADSRDDVKNNSSVLTNSFYKFIVGSQEKENLLKSLNSYIDSGLKSDKVVRFSSKGYEKDLIYYGMFRNRVLYKRSLSSKKVDLSSCDPYDPQIVSTIKKINKLLCNGYPVGVGIYPYGYQISSDGGESYYRSLSSYEGSHALIVKGIEYDRFGTPYLMLRNSYSEGDDKIKSKSVSRMPVHHLCKLSAASFITVLGPTEAAHIKAKNVHKYLELEYFEK